MGFEPQDGDAIARGVADREANVASLGTVVGLRERARIQRTRVVVRRIVSRRERVLGSGRTLARSQEPHDKVALAQVTDSGSPLWVTERDQRGVTQQSRESRHPYAPLSRLRHAVASQSQAGSVSGLARHARARCLLAVDGNVPRGGELRRGQSRCGSACAEKLPAWVDARVVAGGRSAYALIERRSRRVGRRLAEFRRRNRPPKWPDERARLNGGEFPCSSFSRCKEFLRSSLSPPYRHLKHRDGQLAPRRRLHRTSASLSLPRVNPTQLTDTSTVRIQRMGFRQPALLRICQGRPRKAHRLCRGQSPARFPIVPTRLVSGYSLSRTTLSGSAAVPQKSQ